MSRGRLLAVIWTLLIVGACSIPGRDLPEIHVLGIDKIAHFVLFAGFGWLWMQALRQPLPARMRSVLMTGLTLAVLTEFYQALLPFERTPDAFDALANALGLITAVLLYYIRSRRRAVHE